MSLQLATIFQRLSESLKGGSRNVRMLFTLALITISVLVFTIIFEVVIEAVFTGQSFWRFPILTIFSSSCIAAAAAYFGLKKYESLIFQTETAIAKRKQSQAILQRKVAEMRSLQSFTNGLLEQDNFSLVMDTIAKGLVDHLGFEAVLAARFSPERESLTEIAVFPLTFAAEDFLRQFSKIPESEARLPASEQCKWTAEVLNGSSVTCRQPQNLFRSLASGLNIAVDQSAWDHPAFISAPLQVKGRTTGMIVAAGSEEKVFRSGGSLVRAADQSALAMETAFLFQHVCNQREELRQLRLRLEEAEETERKRLAAGMHDIIGQKITAIGINLEIINSRISPSDAEISERVRDSYRLLDSTMGHIRGIMADLWPPGLDEYGLSGAIRWFADRFSNRTGIRLAIRADELEPRPSALVERSLFRIAQEALTNVAKHSGAQEATLVLEKSGERILMLISDEGGGFDADLPRDGSPRWGLRIMKERAEVAGGILRVYSRPGEGTRISVEIDYGNEQDHGFPCR